MMMMMVEEEEGGWRDTQSGPQYLHKSPGGSRAVGAQPTLPSTEG